MKTTIKFLVLIAAGLCAQCVDDQRTNNDIRFTFTLSDHRLDPAAKLLVNIQSLEANPVFVSELLDINLSGSHYVSSVLELKPGNYSVVEFMVVDNDRVIYAAPIAATAALSSNKFALPGKDEEMSVYVVNASLYAPEKFRLNSFDLKKSFVIQVENFMDSLEAISRTKNSSPIQTWVLDGNDTLCQYSSNNPLQRISIDGDGAKTYRLIVSQTGWGVYHQDFILSEQNSKHQFKAQKILLKPAFNMTANHRDGYGPFAFSMGGKPGSTLNVTWGDGTIEYYVITSNEIDLSHDYVTPGEYPISIGGDLNEITYFYSFYGQSYFSEISFKRLPNLEHIRYGLTQCPPVVDFRYNNKLEFAMLPNLDNMEKLVLPTKHNLKFLEITGPNKLTTPEVDAIIDNIYKNTIRQNIRDGSIVLYATWYGEDEYSLIGPPSPSAMEKINYLVENYGWQYYPHALEGGI